MDGLPGPELESVQDILDQKIIWYLESWRKMQSRVNQVIIFNLITGFNLRTGFLVAIFMDFCVNLYK